MNTTDATNAAPALTRRQYRVGNLRTLRFGVELETVGLDQYAAARTIQGLVGGTIAPGTTYLGGWVVTATDGRQWKAVRDGSLRDASGLTCEVVTPILTWADMDLLQALVRALRAAGARVNESCGMHVHVDGAGFKTDPTKVRNLIALAARWENGIFGMANVIPARLYWCKQLPAETIARFRRARLDSVADAAAAWYGNGPTSGHYNESRYHWINVHALFDKGTIEFRLFNGTVHAGRVKANVLFALGFASAALTGSKIAFTSPETAIDAKTWTRFLAHVLCLTGDDMRVYREHLSGFVGGTVAEAV